MESREPLTSGARSRVDPGYRLRVAEERDLAALPAIERRATQLYRGRLEPAVLELVRSREELEAGRARGWLWVAVDADDRPVGFALARELVSGVHLEELDVDPEHGRRGLGRALVSRVCRAARRRGLGQVTLTTYADVPWNAPYYERLGFRVLAQGEIPEALRGVIDGEIRMGLDWKRRVVMRRRVERLAVAWPWLAAAWLLVFVALSVIASRRPFLLGRWLRDVPITDKEGHFLLMGVLAFCAVLAFAGRSAGGRRIGVLRVLGWVAGLVVIEELAQYWLPLRSFSLRDLAASLAGVASLGGLAGAWQALRRRRAG